MSVEASNIGTFCKGSLKLVLLTDMFVAVAATELMLVDAKVKAN